MTQELCAPLCRPCATAARAPPDTKEQVRVRSKSHVNKKGRLRSLELARRQIGPVLIWSGQMADLGLIVCILNPLP